MGRAEVALPAVLPPEDWAFSVPFATVPPAVGVALGTDGVPGLAGVAGVVAGVAGVVAGVAGAAGDGTETPTDLHWLAGGVLTLQAPGSSSARVLLMVTPSEDAPPPSTMQRHLGFDVTTLDSDEQQEELGLDVLPDM